jgi:osmoprotectant transport system permease protein
MAAQLALLPDYLTGHLQLTLLALLVGIAVSVPLGIVLTRREWLERPTLGVVNAIQTIPSLALLAVMVPLLAALGLPSIGFLPAIIGLSLYSLLPILRNTVAGIRGVDRSLVEAARSVGMTPAEQLRIVELPLALPLIVAGIRTAAVWTVGMATLATPVGATSLGNYIFAGLQTRSFPAVLTGSVAAAVLALVLDGLVGALETGVRQRRRGRIALALAVLAVLASYAVATGAARLFGRERAIVVGAKNFTEQYILAEILREYLRDRSGLATEATSSLGSTVVFDALRSGEVDVYVDYCGTLWSTILQRSDVPADRKTCIDETRRFLAERYGVGLISALGFENAYALAMRRSDAERLGVRTIGDLVRHAPDLTIGGDYEFFARPEWRSVKSTYGLRFAEQRSMDPALMYQAAAQGSVDVISAFTTDGRIDTLGLVLLEDDRHAIPPYDAVVLASPHFVRERPDLVADLETLTGSIPADEMRALNHAVDEGAETPAAVARRFLNERAWEPAPSADPSDARPAPLPGSTAGSPSGPPG